MLITEVIVSKELPSFSPALYKTISVSECKRVQSRRIARSPKVHRLKTVSEALTAVVIDEDFPNTTEAAE